MKILNMLIAQFKLIKIIALIFSHNIEALEITR